MANGIGSDSGQRRGNGTRVGSGARARPRCGGRRAARRLFPAAAVLPLLIGGIAAGHESDFVLSRDWELPKLGEREIEAWSTYAPQSNDFEQKLKFEYGVTDWFAIEPSLEWTKPNADSFELSAAELEAYVNFRSFGHYKLLPALEGEFEYRIGDLEDGDEGESRDQASLRGILSWYTPAGEDWTTNLIVTRRLGSDAGWEGEWTAGYLRPLDFVPGITPSRDHPVGVGLEFSQLFSDDHFARLGPVLTWRATETLHVVVNATVALNHRGENQDEFRLLLEGEF